MAESATVARPYARAAFEYAQVPGLSAEALQKLERVRPLTLGQAGRISGVTPADIQLLSIVLETRRRRESKKEK